MRKLLSAGIGAAILLGACGSGTLPTGLGGGRGGLGGDPRGTVHLSTVAQYGGSPAIDAPPAVAAGDTFTVSFSTLAWGCDGPYTVTQEMGTAAVTLTPYNLDVHQVTYARGAVCPDFGTFVQRTVPVVFNAPGTYGVKVYGYIMAPDESVALGTIQKTVVVTP